MAVPVCSQLGVVEHQSVQEVNSVAHETFCNARTDQTRYIYISAPWSQPAPSKCPTTNISYTLLKY